MATWRKLVFSDSPEFTGDLVFNFSEHSELKLPAVGITDQHWSGIVEAGTAGATIAFGELCYFKASDSEWYLAKADAASTSGPVKLGMCVTASSDGSATKILLWGKIRANSLFDTFTISAPVFISAATAGKIVSTAPSGTTNFVIRIVGHANSGDEVFFHPSNDYLELA